MKRLFGYIRVSTTRQAEKGVSLAEQRAAIEAYAAKNGFEIVDWYEEHITAAKRGRPLFTAMLTALRQGKAEGIVIHKIDRSARNLGDWADLGELIDAGFDIHLAHEPLDLRSRGGRLSADILAVVAADFVRNNRQEARKGFYGRLKQGIYPLGAPIGYLFRGKGGNASKPDWTRAHVVRYAFERYASGEIALLPLLKDVTAKGLRNRRGKPLSLTGLVTILRNPFYAGLIRLRKTGETFTGKHEPIIRMQTFRRVQDVLNGKKPRRVLLHDYLYRRLFACATCERSLVGSIAKGRVYYRCQTLTCPTTSIREDALENAVIDILRGVTLPEAELTAVRAEIEKTTLNAAETIAASRAQINGQLGSIAARLERLTDVYVEGKIDREPYMERRESLLRERQELTDALETLSVDHNEHASVLVKCLELARDAEFLYESAYPAEKRRLLEIMTSNRRVSGRNVEIATAEPFCFLSSVRETSSGALDGGEPRTASSISTFLLRWLRTSGLAAASLYRELDINEDARRTAA